MKHVLVAILAGFIGYAGASYDSKASAQKKWDNYHKNYTAALSVCINQGKHQAYCEYIADQNTRHLLPIE